MLRRLFALIVLVLLVGGGLLFWRIHRNLPVPSDLGDIGVRVQDAKLIAKVKAALSLHERLKTCRIQVSVEDSVVTLRGRVTEEALKPRAKEVVSAVPGVRQVVNHLHVSQAQEESAPSDGRTFGETLDDRTLEIRVHLAFSLNRSLEGTDIDVAVFRKEVTLSGEVATVVQRQAAVRIARETTGVAGVIDRLRVRGAESTLAIEARQTLAANPNLSRYKLSVLQENGRLVISGHVRTGAEKDLAELLVRTVTSAEVDNQVEISGGR